MTGRKKYDAVIVGARAAGAATAMLMARRGMRVLAVDRARYGSDTLSTHALMRTGVMQLNRWGLLHRVRTSGAPVVNRVAFHYPEQTTLGDSRPTDGIAGLFAPRRTVLDRLLVDAARESGADIRFGVIVDEVLRNDTGRVTGVRVREESGSELDLTADLVVGADGIRSIVAQSVNAEVLRRAHNTGAVVYGYYSGVPAVGFEWAYAPGLSAGMIPTNDGQICVFIGGSESTFRQRVFPSLEKSFMKVLWEVAPDIADRVNGGRLMARHRGFSGVRGYVRASHGDGWALVGDAGYFRDPITTHGISDAFRDAELLARAAGGEFTMSTYQSMRDSVIGGLFEVTDRIAGYDWAIDDLKVYLREVSRAMKPELELIEKLDRAEAA